MQGQHLGVLQKEMGETLFLIGNPPYNEKNKYIITMEKKTIFACLV